MMATCLEPTSIPKATIVQTNTMTKIKLKNMGRPTSNWDYRWILKKASKKLRRAFNKKVIRDSFKD
jgi:hypothetical protein